MIKEAINKVVQGQHHRLYPVFLEGLEVLVGEYRGAVERLHVLYAELHQAQGVEDPFGEQDLLEGAAGLAVEHTVVFSRKVEVLQLGAVLDASAVQTYRFSGAVEDRKDEAFEEAFPPPLS